MCQPLIAHKKQNNFESLESFSAITTKIQRISVISLPENGQPQNEVSFQKLV